MIRRCAAAVCLIFFCAILGGCWNYRGLDTLDIVTGVSVDRDAQSGFYQLVFEIVDIEATADESAVQTQYVEAEGETLFSAIRNAKKRLVNRLYGGNLQTIIISHQIASGEGVFPILEEFLRDAEPRETLRVAISQQERASDLLRTKGLDSKIIAYEIHGAIAEDKKATAATVDVALYQAYNAIKGTGNALVLPALRTVVNGEDITTEVNGIALFKGDKLIGYLTPEQTKYFLFIQDRMEGGAFAFAPGGSGEQASFEIKKSNTTRNLEVNDKEVTLSLDIQTTLNLMELKGLGRFTTVDERQQLEDEAAAVIKTRVEALFKTVQQDYAIDAFGLGRLVYQKQPELWRSIADDWDEIFARASIVVNVKVDIPSSGVLKNY